MASGALIMRPSDYHRICDTVFDKFEEVTNILAEFGAEYGFDKYAGE